MRAHGLTCVLALALPAVLALVPDPASAGDYEIGVENFLYRSTSTVLNRNNVFGLAATENLFRVTGSGRRSFGGFAVKAAGFVERQTGKTDETKVTVRQAFAEYKTDGGFLIRAGRQKTSWGSGFVWNPTARLEPPKSPANPATEQPGIDALRFDVSPSDWASLTMVAGRARATLTDLPGRLAREADAQWTGALRARLLVRDTDIALTWVAGATRDGLFGVDLGRTWGPVALHAESALYRGSEIDPAKSRDVFLRVAAGGLWSPGNNSFSFEYFFNGEGMSADEFTAYEARLDRNLAASLDPRLPEPARAAAFGAWSRDAAIPFSANLGLRRHYLSLSFSRREVAQDLDLNLRAVTGLADRGLILTPGLAYAPSPHVRMSLDAILLFGPEQAEYRLAPIRRAFQARVRYSF